MDPDRARAAWAAAPGEGDVMRENDHSIGRDVTSEEPHRECHHGPVDWAKGPVWMVSITWVIKQVIGIVFVLMFVLGLLILLGPSFMRGFREGLNKETQQHSSEQLAPAVSSGGPVATWDQVEHNFLGRWDSDAKEFHRHLNDFDQDFQERTRRFDESFQRDLNHFDQQFNGIKRRMEDRFNAATAKHTKAMVDGVLEHQASMRKETAEWRKAHPPSGRPLPPGCPSMGEISRREERFGELFANAVANGGFMNPKRHPDAPPLPEYSAVVLPSGCPSWSEQFDNQFWEQSDQLQREIDKKVENWIGR
jgi:hypothetical protein